MPIGNGNKNEKSEDTEQNEQNAENKETSFLQNADSFALSRADGTTVVFTVA